MTPQDKERIGEQLSAYLDGELTIAERAEMESLLATDAEAQAMLAELQIAVRDLRSLPRENAPAEILAEITTRLERDELLGAADEPVTLARHKRRTLRSTLAMAATIVIGIGGGLWVSFEVARRSQEPATRTAKIDRQLDDAVALERLPENEVGMQRLTEKANDQQEAMEDAIAMRSDRGAPILGSPPEESARSKSPAAADQSTLHTMTRQLTAVPLEPPPTSSAAPAEEPASTAGLLLEKSEVPYSFAEADKKVSLGLPLRDTAAGRMIDGDLTLEQKLEHGAPITAVQIHRFETEPLQLAATFTSTEARGAFRLQLAGVFDRYGAAPLAPAAVGGDAAFASGGLGGGFGGGERTGDQVGDKETVLGEAGQGSDHDLECKESPLNANTRLYFQGQPTVNYDATSAAFEEYIARVPPAAVAELIALVEADDASRKRELSMGGMTATTAEEIRSLAGIVLGEPVDSPALEAADAGNGAEAQAQWSIDLAEMLAKVGFAPSSLGRLEAEVADDAGSSDDEARLAAEYKQRRQFADGDRSEQDTPADAVDTRTRRGALNGTQSAATQRSAGETTSEHSAPDGKIGPTDDGSGQDESSDARAIALDAGRPARAPQGGEGKFAQDLLLPAGPPQPAEPLLTIVIRLATRSATTAPASSQPTTRPAHE